MILSTVNIFSDFLKLRCSLNVILPQRTTEERKSGIHSKYRVLYLLHGYTDDQTAWQRWTSIERYVEGKNLAVIMPAIHNSFYTDMVHGGRYFSYLTEEVPAILCDLFPLATSREDTYVAGLSMGGYGAFKLALSRPDKFSAAASLSGALDIRSAVAKHDDPENEAWRGLMAEIFGDLDNIAGSEHDLFTLAEKVTHSDAPPRLFQYCGSQDFLYADNLRFRDHIQKLPLDHTYVEDKGDHSWPYWDAMIQKVIAWLPANHPE